MGNYWTGNNRASWHDYRSRKIYHITLKKHPDAPAFGQIAGDFRIPVGSPGSPYLKASPVGRIIKDCLRELPRIHPALRLFQYALMPDHLHLILSVESELDEILGRKLAAFKVLANKRSSLPHVFDRGFNDQILKKDRNLDTIFSYLRQNPYRLAIRRACPDYFSRRERLAAGSFEVTAYGNFQLLSNPFKEQVIVHRADSPEQFDRNKGTWLHAGANGGVLVSPFISPREKTVRTEAEPTGARFILIVHEAFGERYKPAAHDFALCAEGRMLVVSLGLPPKTTLSYGICRQMNRLAGILAGGEIG